MFVQARYLKKGDRIMKQGKPMVVDKVTVEAIVHVTAIWYGIWLTYFENKDALFEMIET